MEENAKMATENENTWDLPIEPEIEIKESKHSFQFNCVGDHTVVPPEYDDKLNLKVVLARLQDSGYASEETLMLKEGKSQSSEFEEENSFQHVQEFESPVTNKICEVCGNLFQAFEHTDSEENRKINFKTCEKCSNYIPSIKLYSKNKSEVCNVYESDLERNRVTHSDLELFKCGMCGKGFNMSEKLIEHIKMIHGGIEMNEQTSEILCDICGNVDGLISIVEDNKALKVCETCNMSRKARLVGSINKESKLFSCDLCSRHFSRKDHAVRHRLLHLDTKPYECYICKKSFTRNDKLLNHLKTHPNAKLFICKVCSQAFADRIELVNHQTTHEHKCSICNKVLKNKKRLQEHMIVHVESRPYSCEFCELTFKTRKTLKRHLVSHSDKNEHISFVKYAQKHLKEVIN